MRCQNRTGDVDLSQTKAVIARKMSAAKIKFMGLTKSVRARYDLMTHACGVGSVKLFIKTQRQNNTGGKKHCRFKHVFNSQLSFFNFLLPTGINTCLQMFSASI